MKEEIISAIRDHLHQHDITFLEVQYKNKEKHSIEFLHSSLSKEFEELDERTQKFYQQEAELLFHDIITFNAEESKDEQLKKILGEFRKNS
jgi:hypothetical protein